MAPKGFWLATRRSHCNDSSETAVRYELGRCTANSHNELSNAPVSKGSVSSGLNGSGRPGRESGR